MDVSQIRTMFHVAETGSLSRAAERLRIAQPALSRQIRLLEEELGGSLFVRHGRGMSLTPLGEAVLAPAGEILARLADIRHLAEQTQTHHLGRVRFGMTSTVAEVMAVPLAREVTATEPRISLCLTSGFSGHLLDWLKREELDCCVSYQAELGGIVQAVPILEESLMLVGSSGQGLDRSTAVKFAEIPMRPLLLPSPLHGLRRILDDIAFGVGAHLAPVLEVDSFNAMIDLVRDGVGMTILPMAPIYDMVNAGMLAAAPIVDPVPTRRVMMVYPADRPISAAGRYIGDTFVRLATKLVEQDIWSGRILAGDA